MQTDDEWLDAIELRWRCQQPNQMISADEPKENIADLIRMIRDLEKENKELNQELMGTTRMKLARLAQGVQFSQGSLQRLASEALGEIISLIARRGLQKNEARNLLENWTEEAARIFVKRVARLPVEELFVCSVKDCQNRPEAGSQFCQFHLGLQDTPQL